MAALLLAGAQSASAKIYHWVDQAGVPHFTDRPEDVPPAYRDQIVDYAEELERTSRINIIEGLNAPSADQASPPASEAEQGAPYAAMPEMEELPGFAADPTEILERLQGPILAVAIALTLVVLGFLFAFTAMGLLVGCRLVGQDSPGFKKAYGIVIVQFLAGLVAGPGVVAIFGQPNVADMGALLRLQALNMGVFLLVHSAVLRGMLCDSMGKSIVLALVTNLVLLGFAILLGVGLAMCAGGAALLGGG
jgi:hypothetical protein